MTQDARPPEQPAVRTTIVGGRPPGSGQPVGPIPRGIEVLLKKAAVDPAFKAGLLATRDAAAREIGLVLEPAEALMLRVAPAAQLESIIAQTKVAPALRTAFLGRAAAVMLVALGAGAAAITGDEAAAAPAAPTSTSQPAGTLMVVGIGGPGEGPAEKTPATAPLTAAEAAAVQDRITKDYLKEFADLAVKDGVTSKAMRLSVVLDAAGAVQSVRFVNLAEAGPAEFRDELTVQVMKWKFPDIHRACTVPVVLEAPQGGPAADPAATPTAPTRFVSRAVVVNRPPLTPFPLPVAAPRQPEGAGAAGAPSATASAQGARATVLAESVAVTKADAAAMQARIIKMYQSAVTDLAGQKGAAGKTARFSLSVTATGGVEAVRFLNADEAGSQEFRDALTGQALKWTFPGLSRAGDATVTIETLVNTAPAARPGQVIAPGPAPLDGVVPAPAPQPPRQVAVFAVRIAPEPDAPRAPAATAAKPGRVTVVPGNGLTTGDEATPPAAGKPTSSASSTSSAAPAAPAAPAQPAAPRALAPGGPRIISAGVRAGPVPIMPAAPLAQPPQGISPASPQQDPELQKVRLAEEKASAADAQKRAAEAQAADKRLAEAKIASGVATDAEVAAIQARIAKEYVAAIAELAAKQDAAGKAARIAVALDASGGVKSLQIKNPSEAGPDAFRDALSGQIMNWKFPDVHRACTMMILVETPKEVSAPAGEVAAPGAMVILGVRPAPPPARTVTHPARVTVFPEVVAVTQEDAAAMQARIAKDYQAAMVNLVGWHNIGIKPVRLVRFSLTINAAGGVDTVQFHEPTQADSAEFRDRATGEVLGWTFPGLSRLGAATVVIETKLDAAPAQPIPDRGTVVFGAVVMDTPRPVPPVVLPGRVTVVPGIVANTPAVPGTP